MTEYDFRLRFALPADAPATDLLVERLGEAGCDDALVGIGHPGRLALDFTREAPSAHAAVFSAITDVRRAVPGAELIAAMPDLVGISDVADIMGCSRQNMRKLLLSSSPDAPAPLHEGTPSLWHLATVLEWLATRRGRAVSPTLLETVEVTMHVNRALESMRGDADARAELAGLLG